MHVLTHFASHGLIAAAAHLDQGAGSCVKCSKTSALRIFMSSMARSTILIHCSSFSFVTVEEFPKKLAIKFTQRARHVAHGLSMSLCCFLCVMVKKSGVYERRWRKVKDGRR